MALWPPTTERVIEPKVSVPVFNHGHVMLEDWMGNDLYIVNNARVSFDQESTEFGEKEAGLLNFLMKNQHGSPWESMVMRFDIKAPLFVIREWQRHRIGSFNEQSARYSEIPDDFYIPTRELVRTQKGKPGAYFFETIEDDTVAGYALEIIEIAQQTCFDAYYKLLEDGLAKELARVVLPVGMYSRMKWTVNLRSLLNFLMLRNHDHAQREIREYAWIIEQLVEQIAPTAMKVFNDNGRQVP